MDLLWSLFSLRRRYRHYARLDKHGICLAFRHCATAPVGQDWVEINEPKLTWLHQPLPSSARLARSLRSITARQLITT